MIKIELAQLDKISKQLVNDIDFIEKALEFAINGTKTFLEVASDDQVLHHVTIEYSVWAYCEFGQDKEKYYNFLNSYFKNRKPSGNTLFGWDSPSKDSPNEESLRILDRIDIALNFFKTRLDMEIPYELKGQDRKDKHSIRNGGWEQDKLLKRTKSFALSALDLFALDSQNKD